MNYLSRNVKLTTIQAAVAAGSTDVETSEVDTSGYEGVLLLGMVTPASSQSTCKLSAQSAASTTATFVTIEGSSAEYAAGPTSRINILASDVYKPVDRYVRAYVTRGTSNTAIEGVAAILYGPKKAPVTSTSSDTYLARTVSASSS